MRLGDHSLTRTLAKDSEVDKAKSGCGGAGAWEGGVWRKGCRSGPSRLGDADTLSVSREASNSGFPLGIF
jgi:hypothetical protein